MYDDLQPKHARKFANVGEIIRGAIGEYIEQVRSGQFPTAKESFYMDERALELIRRMTPSADQDMSEAEQVLAEIEEPPNGTWSIPQARSNATTSSDDAS